MQPDNNKIPTSLDCANRKIKSLSFNSYFMYFADFKNGVYFENVVLAKLSGIDIVFIYVSSYDIAEYNTTRSSYNSNILPEDRNFWQ